MTHKNKKNPCVFFLFFVGYSVTLVRKVMQVNVPSHCGNFSSSNMLLQASADAQGRRVFECGSRF